MRARLRCPPIREDEVAAALLHWRARSVAGRAMTETTVVAKALTAAYDGSAPTYSYMIECGGGTAAALHEVQKYPADYNGVVIGGHAAHLTRQIFGQLWLWMAAHPD